MQPNRDSDFDPNADSQTDSQGANDGQGVDQADTDSTAGAHRTERPAR